MDIEISSSAFEEDFDDISYDPIEIDDSNEEMENIFGL